MLTVDEYLQIRLASRDGMSIRAIARKFGWSRQTIRKALGKTAKLGSPAAASPGSGQVSGADRIGSSAASTAPLDSAAVTVVAEVAPRYRLTQPRPKKLDPFASTVTQILSDDASAPVKQRHTAMRIFERLRDEHSYSGGYDQVRRLVQSLRGSTRPTFLPIHHEAGDRIECDFGHLQVDFPTGRRLVAVLLMTWSYSGRVFALALPNERVEAVLAGMTQGFAYFGGVPREVWWDNPKTVATKLLVGRERELHERYRSLAAHYRFAPKFCMPATPTEKPRVENRVKQLQRRWGTPVPQCGSLAELNEHLRRCCDRDLSRIIAGQTETIAARFEHDRAAALAPPRLPFDACITEPATVDKYQMVQFDNHRYSVPTAAAFLPVIVKAYVERIVIVQRERVVAIHPRSDERGRETVDPLHYLPLLRTKPGLVDHTQVFLRWQLPTVFTEFRERVAAGRGAKAGQRGFVELLLLLREHPLERVTAALEHCVPRGLLDVKLIAQQVERLADREPAPTTLAERLQQIQVAPADLTKYDALLTSGDVEPANVDADQPHRDMGMSQADTPVSATIKPLADHGGSVSDAPAAAPRPSAYYRCSTTDAEPRKEPDDERSDEPAREDEPAATALADDGQRVRGVGPGGDRGESDPSRLLAATDGTRSGGAVGQCLSGSPQAGRVPDRQGPGDF